MDEYIPINYINKYICNLVKNNIKNNFKVKGIIKNISLKNKNFFFLLKNDNENLINCIFWNSNNFNLINLKKDMIISGISNIDFNIKYGSYYLNFSEINILEDNSNKFDNILKDCQNLGLLNKIKVKKRFNQYIGIITSLQGIVIHDILSVAKKKNNCSKVFIYDSSVQGKKSENDLIKGIEFFNNKMDFLDCIIIARGGGSESDLEVFNNLELNKSVFKSKIPIISGIGHEKDHTIIEHVSDINAITPSIASDITFFNQDDLIKQLNNYQNIIENNFKNFYEKIQKKIIDYHKKIQYISPINYIFDKENTINSLDKKFINFFNINKKELNDKIINIENKLINADPKKNLKNGYTIVYDIDDNIIDNCSLFKSLSKMKMKIIFDDGYKIFTIDKIIE